MGRGRNIGLSGWRFRAATAQYSSLTLSDDYNLLVRESGALGFVYALVRPLAKQSGIKPSSRFSAWELSGSGYPQSEFPVGLEIYVSDHRGYFIYSHLEISYWAEL